MLTRRMVLRLLGASAGAVTGAAGRAAHRRYLPRAGGRRRPIPYAPVLNSASRTGAGMAALGRAMREDQST